VARFIRHDNAPTDARFTPDDDLLRQRDVFAYFVADDSGDAESRAMRKVMYGPVLAAFEAEIAHRADLRRRGRVATSAPSAQSRALDVLIGAVKGTVSIVDILERETPVWPYHIGRTESHSPCPICGGRDRFVITNGPPSLGWCRRCEWGCDIVGFAAQAWGLDRTTFAGLRETVTRLARDYAGLAVSP
jgi:hypothetical protein